MQLQMSLSQEYRYLMIGHLKVINPIIFNLAFAGIAIISIIVIVFLVIRRHR